MKSLYKCDICGKTFDDMTAAYNCEDSHRPVEILSLYDLDEATIREVYDYRSTLQHYGPGQDLPDYIWTKVPVRDKNGCTLIDENGCPQYEVVGFKIDTKSIGSPNSIAYKNALTRGLAEREAKYREYEARSNAATTTTDEQEG